MTHSNRESLAWGAWAVIALALVACSPSAPARSPSASAPVSGGEPRAATLQTFLRGCRFVGVSFVEGASFVHVARKAGVPSPASARAELPPTVTLRVLPDGRVDQAASAPGDAVYGSFPAAAWLRFDEGAQRRLRRWDGSRWAEPGPPSGRHVLWVPWSEGRLLRIEPAPEGGTTLRLEGEEGLPPGFMTPPELARMTVTSATSLPSQGIAAFAGSLGRQMGYVAVVGTTRLAFKNAIDASSFTLSPRADRLLIDHVVVSPNEPSPYRRAVRAFDGRIVGGERLPAVGHLAIDERGVEWLLSSEGLLFQHGPTDPMWRQMAELPADESIHAFFVVRPLGDTIWLGWGEGLYRYAGGALEKAALPPEIDASASVFALHTDREGRLWVVVRRSGDSEADLITTGPVPKPLACDEISPTPGLLRSTGRRRAFNLRSSAPASPKVSTTRSRAAAPSPRPG
jgi:hypothetical protein